MKVFGKALLEVRARRICGVALWEGFVGRLCVKALQKGLYISEVERSEESQPALCGIFSICITSTTLGP